jgi:hypothetical protein
MTIKEQSEINLECSEELSQSLVEHNSNVNKHSRLICVHIHHGVDHEDEVKIDGKVSHCSLMLINIHTFKHNHVIFSNKELLGSKCSTEQRLHQSQKESVTQPRVTRSTAQQYFLSLIFE